LPAAVAAVLPSQAAAAVRVVSEFLLTLLLLAVIQL
jgi:hypothetical protein